MSIIKYYRLDGCRNREDVFSKGAITRAHFRQSVDEALEARKWRLPGDSVNKYLQVPTQPDCSPLSHGRDRESEELCQTSH